MQSSDTIKGLYEKVKVDFRKNLTSVYSEATFQMVELVKENGLATYSDHRKILEGVISHYGESFGSQIKPFINEISAGVNNMLRNLLDTKQVKGNSAVLQDAEVLILLSLGGSEMGVTGYVLKKGRSYESSHIKRKCEMMAEELISKKFSSKNSGPF